MIKLITTETCVNEKVEERIGVVFVSAVVTTGVMKDFMAGIKDIFSGKWKGYSNEVEKVVKSCLEEAIERAQAMGANSIIGLRMNVEPMFTEKLKMFLVTVYGTACIVREPEALGNGDDSLLIGSGSYASN